MVGDRSGREDRLPGRNRPAHASQRMAAPSAPPMEPTQQEQENYKGLDPDVQTLFRQYEIPYHIWGRLAKAGYTTMQDVADRWLSKKDCREQAPGDLGFKEDDTTDVGGLAFTKEFSLRSAIRLGQASEDAHTRTTKRRKVLSDPSAPLSNRAVLETITRRSNLAALRNKHGTI